MKTIDLNCDMGESYGAWKMGDDRGLMPLISSANVACGFHAGDPVDDPRDRRASRSTTGSRWARIRRCPICRGSGGGR